MLGACFLSFRGFQDLSLRHPAGGGFFAGFASGFRWCFGCFECMGREVVVLGVSGLGGVAFSVQVLGACFFSFRGFQTCHFATLRGRVFLLGLRPDLGGVWAVFECMAGRLLFWACLD